MVCDLELIDAIKGRKSIRRFKQKPASMELVREVLDAANYASSASPECSTAST